MTSSLIIIRYIHYHYTTIDNTCTIILSASPQPIMLVAKVCSLELNLGYKAISLKVIKKFLKKRIDDIQRGKKEVRLMASYATSLIVNPILNF